MLKDALAMCFSKRIMEILKGRVDSERRCVTRKVGEVSSLESCCNVSGKDFGSLRVSLAAYKHTCTALSWDECV